MTKAKLNELEKLRQEVEASKEFINVAAHQLQEPLASIKWQLDSLLGGRSGPLKPKQQLVIDEIYAINQDAIRLVKDLLFVARLEGGRLEVDRQKTDLVVLISRIKKRYEPAIKEYRGVMHFDSPKGAIPQVLVDARLLTQAVDNLISNALKYNPTNTHVDIGLERQGGKVVISVRSRGSVIPKAKQGQLFEKFVRGETKQNKKTGGTGLGLFITKEIVELHHGEISFTSVAGKGTTFFITLPIEGKSKVKNEKSKPPREVAPLPRGRQHKS